MPANWPQLIKQGGLTVKHNQATPSQAQMMALIVVRGSRAGAKNLEDVAGAIATAIQESKLVNITTPNRYGCAGIFQQMARYYGGYANTVDPTKAADAFFSRYLPHRRRGLGWMDASDKVQSSGHKTAPGAWYGEALRAARFFAGAGKASVTGGTGVTLAGQDSDLTVTREKAYEFARGSADGGREDTWEASGRLASEVGWARYFNERDGAIWLASEEYLLAQPARYKLSERSVGVINVTGEFEGRLKAAEVNLQVIAGKYDLVKGDRVVLFDLGPFDGDWLVSSTRLNTTTPVVDVTLKRAAAKLPEPAPETEQITTTITNGTMNVTGPGVDRGGIGGGVPAQVVRAYQAAEYYTRLHMPYAHNGSGRHGLVPHPSPRGDCSSGVSWVLWQAGIRLPGGVTSGWAPSTSAYPGWGEKGPGRYFTIYVRYYGDNAHIWIRWNGVGSAWRFDTGGGLAPHQQNDSRYTDGFVVLHAPGC